MQLIRQPSLDLRLGPSAVALGFFDGVHLGHQHIIKSAIAYATQHSLSSVVVSFDKHPRSLTSPQAPLLITDLDTRLALFENLGVDLTLLLDFNTELMELSPQDYLDRYLWKLLDARYISLGFDHHFGKARSGDSKILSAWAKSKSIETMIAEPVSIAGLRVNSSTIREKISQADISSARQLLGHDYILRGTVIHGEARGRTLGFPTANLELAQGLLLPPLGVYVVKVLSLEGQPKALMNIGMRPSFGGEKLSIEVYIPDFNCDLYGSCLKIALISKLRDEIKFNSPEELVAQITRDLQGLKTLSW